MFVTTPLLTPDSPPPGSSEDTDSSAAEADHLATEPEEDADTDAKPPAVLEANKPKPGPLKASQSKTLSREADRKPTILVGEADQKPTTPAF